MAAAASVAAETPTVPAGQFGTILSALRAEYPDSYATSVYDVASESWIPWAESDEKFIDMFYGHAMDERTVGIARDVLQRAKRVAVRPTPDGAPPFTAEYARFIETVNWDVAVAKRTRDIVVDHHRRHAPTRTTNFDCVLVVQANELCEGLNQLRVEIRELDSLSSMIEARERWYALHSSRTLLYATATCVPPVNTTVSHMRQFWIDMHKHGVEDLVMEEERCVAATRAAFAAARVALADTLLHAIAASELAQIRDT